MYGVELKLVPRRHIVSQRTHTSLPKLGETFAGIVDGIRGRIAPLGEWPAGAPFAIYYNQPFKPDDIDVEIGVPVMNAVAVGGGLNASDLPGERVASTTHIGSYGAIGGAYEELFNWIHEHGLETAGPPREIYIVGPAQTDRPAEYVTEIDVPIRDTTMS